MKVKTESYKIRFKKKNADQMLIWLSGLVHTLAPMEKNSDAALLTEAVIEVTTPAVANVVDIDRNEVEYAAFYSHDLPELKAARRRVAAAVRSERMR